MGATKDSGAEPVQEGESNSSPAGRSHCPSVYLSSAMTARTSSHRRLIERLPRVED